MNPVMWAQSADDIFSLSLSLLSKSYWGSFDDFWNFVRGEKLYGSSWHALSIDCDFCLPNPSIQKMVGRAIRQDNIDEARRNEEQ